MALFWKSLYVLSVYSISHPLCTAGDIDQRTKGANFNTIITYDFIKIAIRKMQLDGDIRERGMFADRNVALISK